MSSGPISGILNINKPYGITSMDVVRRIKRASGIKRVGHGGTLDPAATGVIPVCMGQATRVMEYLVDGTKDYRAVVELGVTTDTYDALGQVTGTGDPSGVTVTDVEAALEQFRGVIHQVPPMYSALKRQGKRLYELARAGIEVEREPRRVETFKVDLVDWSPPSATVEVNCGRGFYMRSFASDLGETLRCGGCLKALERLRSGPFHIADALDLSDAVQHFADDTWRENLYAPDVVLHSLRAVIVGQQLQDRIVHGQSLSPGLKIPYSRPDERCRAYTVDGKFMAVITFDAAAGQWRPVKVFAPDSP